MDKYSNSDNEKYLIFNVGDILYGTPLLAVKEIVKPQKYQKIPQSSYNCLGAINLRGEVMGVLDLNVTFGTTPTEKEGNLLIFETGKGPIAALVDKVISVSDIKEQDISLEPTVKSKVPLDYMFGIAKQGENLVNIIDLAAILSVENLEEFQSGVKIAS